jgi:DNA-binding transcriptional ArsR family regulator
MSRQRSEASTASTAATFAALGDTVRLTLISRLLDGDGYSLAELANGTKITRQGVAKHLAVLTRAQIVTSRRVGRESRFMVRVSSLRDAASYLEPASVQWDEAVARLKAIVEE